MVRRSAPASPGRAYAGGSMPSSSMVRATVGRSTAPSTEGVSRDSAG
ncbi:hypothetical protein ACFFX0_05780 [Citricoccus parietis]|uniref:Uncharacterized protein n=1 Tax=Citricoccus parietis TaxID=592307 RepID=A0ABV5FVL8_9MICC